MTTAVPDDRAVREAEELLNDNVCPICLCRKDGKNPRHQLVMHFRRAVDAEHKRFRMTEYKKHFKVGRTKSEVTPECIYRTLESRFGKEIAQKYIH
jgi:hypothetical protein